MPAELLSDPPWDWQDVTVSDTADLVHGPCVGFWCDGAGVIKVVTHKGTTQTFTVQAGSLLPGRFKQVFDTGTTCDDLGDTIHAAYQD